MIRDLRYEPYPERLARMFPSENHDAMKVGGNHVFDITIQVTEECNLQCTYCYQHDKTVSKLDIETGKRFIDLILASDERSSKYIKSKECPGVVLNFIGGEPFLEVDLVDELTDYFIQRMIELDHPWLNRYRLAFSSNGMCYFEPKVQKYLNKNIGHLSMTITIDGNKELHDLCRLDLEGHGSYDRAFAAAQDWYQKTGQIETKVTISPDNVLYLSSAIIDFIKAGRHVVNANCVYEEGWKPEHASLLYNELKRIADFLLDNDLDDTVYFSMFDNANGEPYDNENTWCGGSGLMLAVDTKGDLYPCLRYTPSSVGHSDNLFKIGDVEHGLIYNEEQQERLRCLSCITRTTQCKDTKCEDCPIAKGCGDCAAYSYEVYGVVGKRTTFICDCHVARVLATCYYYNKKAKKKNISPVKKMNCPENWAITVVGENEYKYLCELAKGD